jgi:hypothetical protein
VSKIDKLALIEKKRKEEDNTSVQPWETRNKYQRGTSRIGRGSTTVRKNKPPPPQPLAFIRAPAIALSLLSSLISPTSATVPKDKVDLTFRAFNSQKGKNGQITKEKFLDVMTKEGAAEREFAEAIFESFDKDSSGCVVALPCLPPFLSTHLLLRT